MKGGDRPGIGVPPSQPAARLDVSALDATVRELFSAGLAPATQRNYQSGIRQYVEFCAEVHIHNPFPVTESSQLYFVAWIYKKQLVGSTVKNYLAAVR